MRENREQRSRIMRAVKSGDTTPELQVRHLVHALGFRFRLHRKDLPGKPDLVFPRLRKAVFVHGCFWHGHHCTRGARIPVHNRNYWTAKIARNVQRDERVIEDLKLLGWGSLTVWECELKDTEMISARLQTFLGKTKKVPNHPSVPLSSSSSSSPAGCSTGAPAFRNSSL